MPKLSARQYCKKQLRNPETILRGRVRGEESKLWEISMSHFCSHAKAKLPRCNENHAWSMKDCGMDSVGQPEGQSCDEVHLQSLQTYKICCCCFTKHGRSKLFARLQTFAAYKKLTADRSGSLAHNLKSRMHTNMILFHEICAWRIWERTEGRNARGQILWWNPSPNPLPFIVFATRCCATVFACNSDAGRQALSLEQQIYRAAARTSFRSKEKLVTCHLWCPCDTILGLVCLSGSSMSQGRAFLSVGMLAAVLLSSSRRRRLRWRPVFPSFRDVRGKTGHKI